MGGTVGKALFAFNWEIPSSGLEEGDVCGNIFGENPGLIGDGMVLWVHTERSNVCMFVCIEE